MNGFGRRPLPAAISSMLRPEATDWSCSVTGVTALALVAIAMLDQEPVVAVAMLAVVAHAHEHPTALQLFARERELELALPKRSLGIATVFGAQKPRSHSMTVPPPYSPCGMVPSKSP